jgi:hypothetical protein
MLFGWAAAEPPKIERPHDAAHVRSSRRADDIAGKSNAQGVDDPWVHPSLIEAL